MYAYIIVAILAYFDLNGSGDLEEKNAIGRYFGLANWAFFLIFFIEILQKAFSFIAEKINKKKEKKIKK